MKPKKYLLVLAGNFLHIATTGKTYFAHFKERFTKAPLDLHIKKLETQENLKKVIKFTKIKKSRLKIILNCEEYVSRYI